MPGFGRADNGRGDSARRGARIFADDRATGCPAGRVPADLDVEVHAATVIGGRAAPRCGPGLFDGASNPVADRGLVGGGGTGGQANKV